MKINFYLKTNNSHAIYLFNVEKLMNIKKLYLIKLMIKILYLSKGFNNKKETLLSYTFKIKLEYFLNVLLFLIINQ